MSVHRPTVCRVTRSGRAAASLGHKIPEKQSENIKKQSALTAAAHVMNNPVDGQIHTAGEINK